MFTHNPTGPTKSTKHHVVRKRVSSNNLGGPTDRHELPSSHDENLSFGHPQGNRVANRSAHGRPGHVCTRFVRRQKHWTRALSVGRVPDCSLYGCGNHHAQHAFLCRVAGRAEADQCPTSPPKAHTRYGVQRFLRQRGVGRRAVGGHCYPVVLGPCAHASGSCFRYIRQWDRQHLIHAPCLSGSCLGRPHAHPAVASAHRPQPAVQLDPIGKVPLLKRPPIANFRYLVNLVNLSLSCSIYSIDIKTQTQF